VTHLGGAAFRASAAYPALGESVCPQSPPRPLQPESRPESLDLRVLEILSSSPASKAELSEKLGQGEVSGQLNKVMRDLIAEGRVEYTLPDKPNSRLQKYRLT